MKSVCTHTTKPCMAWEGRPDIGPDEGCVKCPFYTTIHPVTVGTQAELDEYLAPKVDWKALAIEYKRQAAGWEALYQTLALAWNEQVDKGNALVSGFQTLATRFEEVCAALSAMSDAYSDAFTAYNLLLKDYRELQAHPLMPPVDLFPDEITVRPHKRRRPKRHVRENTDTSTEICDIQATTAVEPTPASASILGPSGDEIQGEGGLSSANIDGPQFRIVPINLDPPEPTERQDEEAARWYYYWQRNLPAPAQREGE